ncbi:hypothetical protein A2188_02285 [Candidatus Woesebacteria bacterium RIFOXYA1_FULL_43_9]|uniref:t-SNARE coiled-coil homology domain-containing protein n=1 Tax=Candidatus Woesebacteria bacterium RIFOXYA1_FULL_43_9 TaxID=1802534 RepID=A0A1F8CNC1_9BACT|nr:MAG: hypothetical protein A2188_02285 [Candidatus Woesebacteria bacterium RIFOXYA1_FULL_43_9]
MSDTKMLQAILNRVTLIDQKMDNGFKNLSEKIDKTNHRIDVLGGELAELQDDAPTMEEFEDLGKQVKRLQFKFASKD